MKLYYSKIGILCPCLRSWKLAQLIGNRDKLPFICDSRLYADESESFQKLTSQLKYIALNNHDGNLYPKLKLFNLSVVVFATS